MKTLDEKFSNKFIESVDGCWNWVGAKKKDGYGYLIHENKELLAHRASYLLHIGALDKDSCICHTCDNRLCVNPKHLWQGSALDNDKDKVLKHRQAKWDKHGASKLTLNNVAEIRNSYTKYDKSRNISCLALKYSVSKTTIWKILTYRTWRNLCANQSKS